MNDLALGLLGLKPVPAQSLTDKRRIICRDDGDHENEVFVKIKSATSKGSKHHGKWVAIHVCRAIVARGPLDAAQLTTLLRRHRTTICAAARYACGEGWLAEEKLSGNRPRRFSITDKGRAILRGDEQ